MRVAASASFVGAVLVTVSALIAAAPPNVDTLDWTRRHFDEAGLSFEVPGPWTLQSTDKTRVLLREYPAEDLISALTVEVFPRSASLGYWAKYHRENQILAVYPGCKILSERQRKVGENEAVFFEVTGLTGDQRDYDLSQTILSISKYFVITTLYYPKGRGKQYRPLVEHVVESVRRDSEGVSVSERQSALGPVGKRQIDWAQTFDEAFAEAKRRNVPVMIAFNMDNEWANDLIAKDYYHDPRVVELSRRMVCLVSSVFDHGGHHEAGKKRVECSRFGRITCVEHRDVDIHAREVYIRSRKVIAPQHLFCAPDGRMLLRREWHLPKADLVHMMERSISALERLAAAESGLSLEELLKRYDAAPDDAARHWVVSDVLFSGRPELADEFIQAILAKRTEESIVALMDGLGYAGHPLGTDPAIKALDHKSPQARTHAAVALEQIADPKAADAIKKRLRREREEIVVKNLVRALGACANEDEGIAGVLIGHTKRGSELERANALIALSCFPESEKVRKRLIEMLTDESNGRLRAAAAWSLGKLGVESALDALGSALANENDALATTVMTNAIGRIEGTLDWRFEYDEILENVAGDTIFRRDPVETRSKGQ